MRSIATTAISPTAAAFTAFKKAALVGDCRRRRTKGFRIHANRNAGRKMQSVAVAAPAGPPIKKPRNVAVVSTGPGVN